MKANKDFFISYTHNDEQWATWIAGTLENAGYTTIIQAWDFKPGESFIHNMHKALIDCERFIAVLSEKYFESLYCQAEWENAFMNDPTGEKALFIPVRTDSAEPKGLFASRIYIDLFGKSEEEAKQTLLNGVSTENRPKNAPSFPGTIVTKFPNQLPFNNLPARNPYFTGRAEILENVQKELETGRAISLTQESKEKANISQAILQTQVFKGLGGVGKSELAKEYAFRNAYKYEAVWWVNAESEVSILQAYTDFAFKQKIVNPDEKKTEVIIEAVKNWMSAHEHNRWLFIFDNAESEEMLRKYFPAQTLSEQRHILITSRYTFWKYAKSIAVEVFSEEEASAFFLKRTGLPEDTAMQDLAQILGRLPLALEHAAAYICANEITYKQYLELYQKYGSELLRKEYPYDDALQTIYVTWNISIDKIGKESVRQLLNLCAFFAPDNIHDKWFSGASEFLPSPLQEKVQNDLDYNDVKAELKKYSLVKIENKDSIDKISIHQLVQQVVKNALKDAQKKWVEFGINILQKQVHDDFSTLKSRTDFTEMTPHIISITTMCEHSTPQENTEYIASFYSFLGHGYRELANYEASLEYHQKTLKIWERVLGNEHPNVATSYSNIGLVYYFQGDYNQALKYHQEALKIREKVLGNEHPDMATPYNNIGLVCCSQGDYTQALECHQKALKIKEKVLGNKHPDVATLYNNIGFVYRSQGTYTQALEYYNEALKIRENVCGSEHLDVAQSYNNIGDIYASQDDFAKALEYYQKALTIKEKVLDSEHDDVAASYNNIGFIYDSQGKCSQALEYYQRALKIQEKVFGNKHPDVALSYNNIGAVYYSQGECSQALEYYQKALKIRVEVFSYEHPDVAISYYNIGNVYYSQGDYQEALDWYYLAFIVLFKIIGFEHPHKDTVFKYLLKAYEESGNPVSFEQWLNERMKQTDN